MYFHKIHHPHNFKFATSYRGGKLLIGKEQLSLDVTPYQDSVLKLEVRSKRWQANDSIALLTPPKPYSKSSKERQATVTVDAHGGLKLSDEKGRVLLEGRARHSFGVCKDRWLFDFVPTSDMRFYGMGEKWGPLEHSGKKTKFWNTDVWSDFDFSAVSKARIDPAYASVPYLIVKTKHAYVGILVDNPHAVFMATGAAFGPTQSASGWSEGAFFVGSDTGKPVVYLIVGPSLSELTRKLQKLVGTTPRPPLWALGHHQCRWGYESAKHLNELDRKFDQHEVPTDGLWLDIDYMERFKVFTFDKKHFPQPKKALESLRARGRRPVAIFDPGVKVEPGYPVYEEGKKGGHFCLTPEGEPFVGYVWPGETNFPDFSQPHTRTWWSGWVAKTANAGLSGAWLDMNDPSVGPVELDDMLFDQGRKSHSSFHNQYALGMAMASHEGFLLARPDERPFLLTRSAFTSTGRFAAVWTGDNVSNVHHLKGAIPTTLNLALSGIPFNGPDVPGFGGDADDELMVRWYKAGFLFPVLRNHSCKGTPQQEPWAFSKQTLTVVRNYVRLRYKLLPYLYNLFIGQERDGEAILRPLFYDFPKAAGVDKLDDQFMVGPCIMQAPCFDAKQREVVLPAGDWFDATSARFVAGGRTVKTSDRAGTTPLYVRAGSIVPMATDAAVDRVSRPKHGAGRDRDSRNLALNEIELHLFIKNGSATASYEFDDGESYGYRTGKTTRFNVSATVRGGLVSVDFSEIQAKYKPCRVRVVAYGGAKKLKVSGLGPVSEHRLAPHTWNMVGTKLSGTISPEIQVG